MSVERPERGDHPGRLLRALEQMLALDATELGPTMQQAAQRLAEVLGADKVDVFLHRPEDGALVAIGTSDTPMGRREQALGLDRLPLADGGRAVRVFETGAAYLARRADRDEEELPAIVEQLGVCSAVFAPLEVAGVRRGVLVASSASLEYFGENDLTFLGAVARWLGLVIHRAELVQDLVGYAELRGRRDVLTRLLHRLTPRQREVAALIAGGYTNEQIARQLVLTPGTVANHVEHILRRLDLGSRVEVATLAAELGLHRRGADAPERGA